MVMDWTFLTGIFDAIQGILVSIKQGIVSASGENAILVLLALGVGLAALEAYQLKRPEQRFFTNALVYSLVLISLL